MKLERIDSDFTVCKVKDMSGVDFTAPFVFFSKTDEELSLMCETGRAPSNARLAEAGWRALRVAGELDFALVGVLAKIAGALAEAGVPVFVVSTYNTDYIFMKAADFDAGVRALTEHGYTVE